LSSFDTVRVLFDDKNGGASVLVVVRHREGAV